METPLDVLSRAASFVHANEEESELGFLVLLRQSADAFGFSLPFCCAASSVLRYVEMKAKSFGPARQQ